MFLSNSKVPVPLKHQGWHDMFQHLEEENGPRKSYYSFSLANKKREK